MADDTNAKKTEASKKLRERARETRHVSVPTLPPVDPATEKHTVICPSGKSEEVVGAATLPKGWFNIPLGPYRRVAVSSEEAGRDFLLGKWVRREGVITSRPLDMSRLPWAAK